MLGAYRPFTLIRVVPQLLLVHVVEVLFSLVTGRPGHARDVITAALTQQKNAKVFAAVLLASLLGLALFGLINLVSRVALRHWHASEQR